MKNKLCRLSLLATGILATSGIPFLLTSCNKTDNTVGQLIYTDIDANTTSVTGLSNAGDNVKTITVPSQCNGKKVVSIAKGAFTKCPNLETLTLPFIGNSASATGTDAMLGYVFGSTMYDGCGGFTWQEAESDDTNETIYAQYAIPNNLVNVNITNANRIPAGAFSNCKYIENISFTNTNVMSIENKAFYCCSSLEKFDFSSLPNLRFIDDSAFSNCYTLNSITIPNTVVYIGSSAFYKCVLATKAIIPSSVAIVKEKAFSNIGGIVLVETKEDDLIGWDSQWSDPSVPVVFDYKSDSSFAYVDDWFVIICGSGNDQYGYLAQWMGNWEQTTITIPSKLTVNNKELPIKTIGGQCFSENIYIKQLTIEEGITTIHPYVFNGCTSLQYVSFPTTLTQIRDQAFKNCTSLIGRYVDGVATKGLDFCNVKQIGKQAFYGCSALTNIQLEHVEEICNEAFAYCTHLCQDMTEDNVLSIPTTCTSLGEGSFKWCFKYAPDGYTSTYFYPTIKLGDADTDPSSLTNIPESCFESCGVRVKTPTSGEDKGTIYPNYVRVSVNLGGAPLTRIEDAAFKNCFMYNLTGARNTHLQYIGNYAFYYAQMTSDDSTGGKQDLQIDQEIEYIGDYAFAYCSTIWKLTFNTSADGNSDEGYNSLKHLGQYAFYGCNNANFTSLDLSPCKYLTNYTNGDSEPETYDASNTPRYAFAQCTHLQTVKLPGSVSTLPNTTFTRLPERMFEGCTDLGKTGTAITVPSQITDIRAATFNGCNYLTKCYINGTINYYGSSIFSSNYLLESVTKSDGTAVTFNADIPSANIGSNQYYKCESLTNPPIPVGTNTSISYSLNGSMFYLNKSLTSISIPNRVASIGTNCFWGCSSLTSVTLTSDSILNTIYASAFEGCSSLNTLDLSKCSKLYRIYDKAFCDCKSTITITLPNRSITFYSKPFDSLTSSATIKFGKNSVTGYSSKTWDYPETFTWAGNSTVTFTRNGLEGSYYYTCSDFGGSNVHFVYYE